MVSGRTWQEVPLEPLQGARGDLGPPSATVRRRPRGGTALTKERRELTKSRRVQIGGR